MKTSHAFLLTSMLLLSSGCEEIERRLQGNKAPGRFRIQFVWENGEPAFPNGVYLFGRVEERTDPRQNGTLLSEAGPIQYPQEKTLRFSGVDHGDNRVVIVEFREAPSRSAVVLHYGISAPFSLQAGDDKRVEVLVQMAEVPQSPHNPTQGLAGVEVESPHNSGYVASTDVSLLLLSKGSVRVKVSNLISFPETATREWTLSELPSLSETDIPEGYQGYRLDSWDLDLGITDACSNENYCPRRVFVRFLDSQGYESDIQSATIVLDTLAPEISNSDAVLSPAPARADALVRLQVVSHEILIAPPEVTVLDADSQRVEFPFRRVLPESADQRTSVFVFEAEQTAEYLPGPAPHHVALTLRDLAGNVFSLGDDEDGLPLLLDFAAPQVNEFLVTPLKLSKQTDPVDFHTLSVSFLVNEDLESSPASLTARVVDQDMQCTRSTEGTGFRHQCLYQVSKNETEEGPRIVRIVATDSGGNQTVLSQVVEFDFTAPQVQDFGPSKDAYNASDTIIYMVDVSEPLGTWARGTSDVPTLIVKRQGENESIDSFGAPLETSGTSFTWKAAASALQDGVYDVKISMVDSVGNASAEISLDRPFQVDRIPPQLDGPLELNHDPPFYMGSDVLAVAFTVNEPLQGKPVVSLRTDPAVALPCVAGADNSLRFSCQLNQVVFPSGLQQAVQISLEITDQAGNSRFDSTAVVLDSQPPALLETVTRSGYRLTDNILYTVNVSEALQGIEGRPVVHVYNDGELQPDFFTQVLRNADTSFTFQRTVDTPDLEGSYTVHVDLTDVAGNQTLDQLGRSFTVDATLPLILAGPALNKTSSSFKQGDSIEVRFTASEPLDPSSQSVSLNASRNGTSPLAFNCSTTDSEDRELVCVLPDALDGTEQPQGVVDLSLSLTDSAGNMVFEVVPLTLDFTNPSILQGVASQAFYKRGDTILVTLNTSESLGEPDALPILHVFRDGVEVPEFFNQTSLVTHTDRGFSYQKRVEEAADGVYQIVVDLTDRAGNVSDALEFPTHVNLNGVFAVDTQPPELTSGPTLNKRPAVYALGQTISVQFTLSETLGQNPEVVLTTPTPVPLSCQTNGNSGGEDYLCQLLIPSQIGDAPEEGESSVSVRVMDRAGNNRIASIPVRLDYTAPNLTSSTRASKETFKNGDIVFYQIDVSERLQPSTPGGPAIPTVRVYRTTTTNSAELVQGLQNLPTQTSGLSFTYFVPVQVLGDGEYAVEVDLVDEAGNANLTLQGPDFKVDITTPRIQNGITPNKIPPIYNKTDVVSVSFTVSEAMAAHKPLVSLRTEPMLEMPCTANGLSFVCSTTLTEDLQFTDDPEGLRVVHVELEDAAGNVASPSTLLTLDFTTPTVISSKASASRYKAGDIVRYHLNVSEPLQPGGPQVRVWKDGVQVGQFMDAMDMTNDRNFVFSKLVNPSMNGTYQVDVSLVDLAGNTSAPDLRDETIVVDTIAPSVTLQSLSTSNVFNNQQAAPGDTVTVRFTVDETLNFDPEVGLGQRAMSKQSDSPWTYEYTVQNGIDSDGMRPVSVRVVDLAGNITNLSLGTVPVDVNAPRLTYGGPNLPVYKRDATVIYAVSFSEPLRTAPIPTVRHDGQTEPGFLVLAEGIASGTAYVFRSSRTLQSSDNGQWTVQWSAEDPLGNQAPALDSSGFQVVADAPVITVESVKTNNPYRTTIATSNNQVEVRFTTNKVLTSSPVVTVGGIAMTRQGGSDSPYFYSYSVNGNEGQGQRDVVIMVSDDAGNVSNQYAGSITFDFSGPSVVGASVDYRPPPGHPLNLVEAATVGTTVVVHVSSSEPLGTAITPTLTASVGATTWPLNLTASSSMSVEFESVVPPAAVDGVFNAVLRWCDAAGNEAQPPNSTITIAVKTSQPVLTVDQSKVVFVRSPWGNNAAEDLSVLYPVQPGQSPVTIPGGPYYALAPSEPLSNQSSLAANTFTVNGGQLKRIRVWADSERETLLGTTGPNNDGTWPRLQLFNLDAPWIFVSALDQAGNESEPVRILSVEWVATQRQSGSSSSPHLVEGSTRLRETLQQDELTVQRPSSQVQGQDGTAWFIKDRGFWRRRTVSDASPSPRHNSSLSYDSTRGRVVLFAGTAPSAGGFQQDVWEWDGFHWTEATPSFGNPAARALAMLVYDSALGRTLMYGGNGPQDRTIWEWDGTTWSATSRIGNGPIPDMTFWSAYDSIRNRVVLYSVWDYSTWELDWASPSTPSSPWRQVSTTGPVINPGACMVFDVRRGVTVLFGGLEGFGIQSATNDVWEWDGTSWQQREINGAIPSAREAHACAADPSQGMLVFGGRDVNGSVLGDLWLWDGNTWQQLVTAGVRPAARMLHAMAYDGARQRLVLVGGQNNGGQDLADVWEWNGIEWNERTPNGLQPAPRFGAGMVYDTDRKRHIVVGGFEDTPPPTIRVWEWDGARWLNPNVAGQVPVNRSFPAFAFDEFRHNSVMFGGSDFNMIPQIQQDTWEWLAESWNPRFPASVPPARMQASVAYDRDRHVVVLFGGYDQITRMNDTWEWDGNAWTQHIPLVTESTPAPRRSHAMAYDAVNHVTVMFGGEDDNGMAANDTWTWNGATWTEVTPAENNLEGRSKHSMVYDDQRRRVMMFGGQDAWSGEQNDVWEWSGSQWVERTMDGTLPSARAFAHLSGAPQEPVVMFGGMRGGEGALQDVWELDGQSMKPVAIQFTVNAQSMNITTNGIPASVVTGMRVRAFCGGSSASAGVLVPGAQLLAWKTSGGSNAEKWISLGISNSAGVLEENGQERLPSTQASLLDWQAPTASEAHHLLSERDGRWAFQCRPLGRSGIPGQESKVGLDYVEARVRYSYSALENYCTQHPGDAYCTNFSTGVVQDDDDFTNPDDGTP